MRLCQDPRLESLPNGPMRPVGGPAVKEQVPAVLALEFASIGEPARDEQPRNGPCRAERPAAKDVGCPMHSQSHPTQSNQNGHKRGTGQNEDVFVPSVPCTGNQCPDRQKNNRGHAGMAARKAQTRHDDFSKSGIGTQTGKCGFEDADQQRATEDGCRNRCKEMGVRPSMGTVGDAYDNAMAESFFASLECELIARRTWKTKTEARLAVFTWIESWYNPRRRHSGLGQMSPINFERQEKEKFTQDAEITPTIINQDPIPEKD
jgi:hypothetical protein